MLYGCNNILSKRMSFGKSGDWQQEYVKNLIENEGYIPVADVSDFYNIRIGTYTRVFAKGTKYEEEYVGGSSAGQKYVQIDHIDFGFTSAQEYDVDREYVRNDYARYDGDLYVCVKACKGTTPSDASPWSFMGSWSTFEDGLAFLSVGSSVDYPVYDGAFYRLSSIALRGAYLFTNVPGGHFVCRNMVIEFMQRDGEFSGTYLFYYFRDNSEASNIYIYQTGSSALTGESNFAIAGFFYFYGKAKNMFVNGLSTARSSNSGALALNPSNVSPNYARAQDVLAASFGVIYTSGEYAYGVSRGSDAYSLKENLYYDSTVIPSVRGTEVGTPMTTKELVEDGDAVMSEDWDTKIPYRYPSLKAINKVYRDFEGFRPPPYNVYVWIDDGQGYLSWSYYSSENVPAPDGYNIYAIMKVDVDGTETGRLVKVNNSLITSISTLFSTDSFGEGDILQFWFVVRAVWKRTIKHIDGSTREIEVSSPPSAAAIFTE